MASVTIPYGGQSITVDVSDLASESTLKDLYAESAKQSSLLSAIAQKMGADVQKEINAEDRNTDKLIRAIQEEGRKSDSRLGSMFSKARGFAGTVGSGLLNRARGFTDPVGMFDNAESGSGLAKSLLGTLGLGAMGAQIGTLVGIFEEFGNSMSNLRRVGTGYAEDLTEFRSLSANVGLSLEQLGKLTGESGIAIRALGTNTTSGTKNFLRLNQELRNNIQQFGYFGLNSENISSLLAQETEIRRGMLQTDMSSEQAQKEMLASIKQQLQLNEQMATLTGQDVRDRIKASMAFRSDATNAAMLAKLTEDQRVAANGVIESLTQLGGSAGPMLDTAMSNLLAGLPMDTMNEGFSEFAAFASSEGIDLRGALEQMRAAILSGADPKTVAGLGDQLADQFKNLDPSDAVIKASRAGVKGATDLLQARLESVSSGADTLAGSVDKISEAAEKMAAAAEAGQLQLSGTAAEMGKFAATLRNVLMQEITEAFDMDITSNEFPNFVKQLASLPESKGFRDAISFMSEVTTMLTGAQGLVGLLKGNNAGLAENSALLAAILEASGVPAEITGKIRLGALALDAPELGPEIKALVEDIMGGPAKVGTGVFDESGKEVMKDADWTNSIPGSLISQSMDFFSGTADIIKDTMDDVGATQEKLSNAIDRLISALNKKEPQELPGPNPPVVDNNTA